MIPYPAFNKKRALDISAAPRRVYGTLGDTFLQQRVLDALLEWCLPEEARDFNLDTLSGDGASVNDILALCSNLPFLSEQRVVVVTRAERIENMHRSGDSAGKTASSRSKAGSPSKRLADGIKNLAPTTVLILQRTPETPEPSARAGTPRCVNAAVDKAIEHQEKGLIVNCTVAPQNANLVTAVIRHEAEEQGYLIEPAVAGFLVERCGRDIAHVLSELEKCALRAGAGNPITPAIIEEMTRRQLQETIFDLTDALGKRQMTEAVRLMREMLSGGEPVQVIFAMFVRHLRQLLQARTFLDAGLPLDASTLGRLPPELAEQLPKSNLAQFLRSQGWIGKQYAAQARNFSVPELQAALQTALKTELALKGIEGGGGADSRKEPELLLELFLMQLAR